jgi:O-acetyl-ADP-ribose deacetylase (regulator of RNase III)
MSIVVGKVQTESGHSIEVRQGDLTAEDTEAIVNAANSRLAHGGGVAGAIAARGGRAIQAESDRWIKEHGPVPTGQVAVTGAGNLPARVVIHAVGPVWQGGGAGEDHLLRSAVWNSLAKAEEMKLTSIALPAISSGIFGFPKDRCAAILVRTALEFCQEHPHSHLREIRLTNIDRRTVELFEAELRKPEEEQGRRE